MFLLNFAESGGRAINENKALSGKKARYDCPHFSLASLVFYSILAMEYLLINILFYITDSSHMVLSRSVEYAKAQFIKRGHITVKV